MTRLNDRQLLQYIDGTGVVLIDQSAGTEIVVPLADLARFADAAAYFARHVEPVDRPPGDLGRRLGKGQWQ